MKYHCLKSVRIWSHSGPQFLTFGYELSLRIQHECEKMRTRITPNADTFHTLYENISLWKTNRYQFDIIVAYSSLMAEVYFEPSQISATEPFCKNSSQLKDVNYLHKKATLQMIDGTLNTPLHEVLGLLHAKSFFQHFIISQKYNHSLYRDFTQNRNRHLDRPNFLAITRCASYVTRYFLLFAFSSLMISFLITRFFTPYWLNFQ